MAAPTPAIEHVVLFKTKDDADPSKVDAMISNLRSLISVDVVSNLVAVPILRCRSSDFHFTHLLHCQCKTESDLAAYSAHPHHQAVVKESVPIIDDIMAVDWIADTESGTAVLIPGSAARLTMAKLEEGAGEEEKRKLIALLSGVKKSFPEIEHVSWGKNFSPARAKGFAVGAVFVFPGVVELEAWDAKGEQEDELSLLSESVIIVDFVVPLQSSATVRWPTADG